MNQGNHETNAWKYIIDEMLRKHDELHVEIDGLRKKHLPLLATIPIHCTNQEPAVQMHLGPKSWNFLLDLKRCEGAMARHGCHSWRMCDSQEWTGTLVGPIFEKLDCVERHFLVKFPRLLGQGWEWYVPTMGIVPFWAWDSFRDKPSPRELKHMMTFWDVSRKICFTVRVGICQLKTVVQIPPSP